MVRSRICHDQRGAATGSGEARAIQPFLSETCLAGLACHRLLVGFLFVLGRPDVPPGWGPHGRRGLGTQGHQWRALLPLVVPVHAGGSVPVRPLPEGFICPLFISAARSGCYRHFFTGGIANVAPGTQRKWLRLFPDLVPAV